MREPVRDRERLEHIVEAIATIPDIDSFVASFYLRFLPAICENNANLC